MQKNFFKCKICLRVTKYVMIAIIIIESIILIPSYINYERERLKDLNDVGEQIARSIFKTAGSNPTAMELQEKVELLSEGTILKGAQIESLDGKPIVKFGEPTKAQSRSWMQTTFSPRTEQGKRYQVTWTPKQLNAPYRMIARLDSQNIGTELYYFLWRIFSLILVITLFLTITTMFAINRLLFKPIFHLRNNLKAAGDDPLHPEKYYLHRETKDELHTVFLFFNRMLDKVFTTLSALMESKGALQNVNATLDNKVKKRTSNLEKLSEKLRKENEAKQQVEKEKQSISRFPEENINPILRCDANGILLYANKASQPLLEHWGTERGKPLPETWFHVIKNAWQTKTNDQLELQVGKYWFLMDIIPVPLEKYINLYCTNITQRKKIQAQLTFVSSHDKITGLPGKALFEDRLQQLIKQAENNRCYVMVCCLSISNLKHINSSHGNDVGDLLLRKLSKCFVKRLPDTMIISRFNGSKFSLAMGDLKSLQQMGEWANRIHDLAEHTFIVKQHKINALTHLGIAIYPNDSKYYKSLINDAFMAMYHAKSEKISHIQFYREDMQKHMQTLVSLIDELKVAVKSQQFELYFQPQWDLNNNVIFGVEALLRWHHPRGKKISPGVFIPIAEETGLIIPLGKWIIQTVCEKIKSWQQQGINIPVAVNISAMQFKNPDLIPFITDTLKKKQVDPKLLAIELTESVLAQDTEKTVQKMNKLHAQGIRFSIDDFGTGYSSLSYLQLFPLHHLKIDQAFIQKINKKKGSPIVDTIIGLAHNLNLKLVAEGVETETQFNYLKQKGCHIAQGFYISKPLNERDLMNFIKNKPFTLSKEK